MSINARLTLLHPSQLRMIQNKSAFLSNFKRLRITHPARAARRPWCLIFHIVFSLQVLTTLAAQLYSLYFVLRLRWLHTFSFQNYEACAFEVHLMQLAFANSNPASDALKRSRTVWVNQCDSDPSADSFLRESLARSLNVWLLRVAIVCAHRVKISPVWVTAAIWFFWGRVCLSGDIAQTKSHVNRDHRDLRKKKGKMSILQLKVARLLYFKSYFLIGMILVSRTVLFSIEFILFCNFSQPKRKLHQP